MKIQIVTCYIQLSKFNTVNINCSKFTVGVLYIFTY